MHAKKSWGLGSRPFFLLFLVSGVTGIVFEVVSSKLLGFLMGNSVYSITTVVTAFMAGLALGSWLADRMVAGRRPLFVYGVLEAGVGVFCLAFPLLLAGAQPLIKLAYAHFQDSFYILSFIRFSVAFVLLMIPTTLMGATLPILATGLAGTGSTVTQSVGKLYAINSLGAVIGALSSSFIILPNLGISGTLQAVALVDLTIALAAIVIDRRLGPEGEGAVNAPAVDPAASAGDGTMAWVTLALGLAGFAAMVYEIAWTRTLILVLGSSTYAFSMILACFIAGISLGSYLVTRLDSEELCPRTMLVWLTAGISATGLLTLPLLGQLPIWLIDLLLDFSTRWGLLQACELVLVGSVLVVPTMLMGACFPVATRLITAGGREGTARALGRLYASNTAGNIAGSFSAGALLVPFIGIEKTILVASMIEAFTAALLNLTIMEGVTGARVRTAVAIVVAPILIFSCVPRWDQLVMTSGSFLYAGYYVRNASRDNADYRLAMHRMGKSIFYREGISTTVTVREDPCGDRGLVINGKTDASSVADMKTQRLIGHIPMLLHPSPDEALVVGLGSGVTLASVLEHPVKKVDLLEISPEIVEASRYFVRENRNCLADPRVKLTISDARNHLALSDKTYDVISSEPTNPWIAGVATLFTREYFQLLRSRLKPHGIVSHWVQGYSTSTADFKSVIATFRSVFSNVTLWRSTRGTDYIMVGTDQPRMPDRQLMTGRFKNTDLMQDMVEVGIEDELDLISHFIAATARIDSFVKGCDLITDDNMRLEYTAPRNLYLRDEPLFGLAEKLQEDITAYLALPCDKERQELQATLQSRRHQALALGYLKGGELKTAVEELKEARKADPRHGGSHKLIQAVYLGLTSLLEKAGRSSEALGWLKQVAELHRDDPDLFNEMGNICGSNGRYREAEEYYRKAIALDRNHVGAHKNLALVFYSTGRYKDAIREYEQVVALSPFEPKMHNNLGILYEKVDELAKAKRSWQAALQVDPAFEVAKRNLTQLEARM